MQTITFEETPLIIAGRCVDCLITGEADIDDTHGGYSVEAIRLPAEGGEVELTRRTGGEIFHALAEAILITYRDHIDEVFATYEPAGPSYADEHRLRLHEVL